MVDTSFYNVKVKLYFYDDPLEQILSKTEESAWFNSLESEFEVSGHYNESENVYFNIDQLHFDCINDLRNGIATAVVESNLKLTLFIMMVISAFIKEYNKSFRLIDGDAGAVEIEFKSFTIEDLV